MQKAINRFGRNNTKENGPNVFELQSSISKQIASNIEALVKPEEINRIEKIPTENLEAYDSYLRAMEFLNASEAFGLDSALHYYKKAIALDENFAHALRLFCGGLLLQGFV